MRLAQDLKTIAHSQHYTAFVGKLNNALHNRAKAGNSAGAQIIAIRKTAGKDNAVICVKLREITVLVPKHDTFLFQIVYQSIINISVAIRTWENNKTKFHE